jgi:S-DNA-T family DNA segregation ATPase FtsK/SpoIIIE
MARENPELGEPLPKIIIVIDELNDLMLQVRKPVEGLITNITQKARAAGIHMIIGTQRPSVDVITGVIKANIPTRLACKVTSLTDSRTILDQPGAEKLLNNGDVLYFTPPMAKPKRVQCAFVSDSEVEQVMRHLKSTVKGDIYDEEALAEMTRAAQKCTKGKDDDDRDDDEDGEEGASYLNDKQFLEAVDLAIKSGKISTSLIQRKISVGYGKAAKFIDIMEGLGIVSEPNGQKPRDVLVTRDEWHEMLSRRSLDD